MSDFDPTATYLPVPGYPGYLVGDDGSAWSQKNNHGKLTGQWKRLKPGGHLRSGHLSIGLVRDGKRVFCRVHRLVLEAFVGPCPAGMEACHSNDNPIDNRASNLKWDTRQNNLAQRDQRGRQAHGEGHGRAKLRESDIPNVFVLSALGFSHRRIARFMGVSQNPISKILNGKLWKHATTHRQRLRRSG